MTETNETAKCGGPRQNSLDWWAEKLGVSRRKLNADIAGGKLRALRLGRRTLVMPADMETYLSLHETMPRRDSK